MHERFGRKRTIGFRFADGDPLWTLANVRLYALIALFVGLSPWAAPAVRARVSLCMCACSGIGLRGPVHGKDCAWRGRHDDAEEGATHWPWRVPKSACTVLAAALWQHEV